MRLRFFPHVLIGFAALSALSPCVRAAKPVADILPPERRRAALQIAERLAQPATLPDLSPDLVSPFSPTGFDAPDASEARENRPAAGSPNKAAAPEGPKTDRDVLAAVAARIPTTGTIVRDGKPLLISGVNRIEVGSHFTVVYNGQEFELELTAIERTTFTVRYRGEEFTRPIKLGKSP